MDCDTSWTDCAHLEATASKAGSCVRGDRGGSRHALVRADLDTYWKSVLQLELRQLFRESDLRRYSSALPCSAQRTKLEFQRLDAGFVACPPLGADSGVGRLYRWHSTVLSARILDGHHANDSGCLDPI